MDEKRMAWRVASKVMAARRPEITGDPRRDQGIWEGIEDGVYELIQEALENGFGSIDKSGARKVIRDVARDHDADQKAVEHYFWEEYHNTEWPED